MISQRLEPYWLIGLAVAAALGIIQTAEHLTDHETIPALQEKIQKQPESAPLRERLGNAYIRAGLTKESIPHLQFVIARMPENVTAPLTLAWVYAGQKQITQAQEVLDACLALHPQNGPCNEMLADLLIASLGEDAASATATRLYTIANKNDPTLATAALALSKNAAARGDYEAALRLLDRPLKSHPQNTALHLQAARLLTHLKHSNPAQLFFERATVLDPKNAAAFCDYGAMLVDASRPVAAELVLRKSLELKPKDAAATMHLARALREQAFLNKIPMKEAVEVFKEAVTLNPRNARTYYEWAIIYIKNGEEAYAINFLKDAVRLDDRYADAWKALASLQMYAKDRSLRDPAEGLLSLKEAVVSSNWQDLGLVVAFGRAQANAKHFDAAVDTFERARKLPMTGETFEWVGALQLEASLKRHPPEDPTSGIDIDLLLPRSPLDPIPWPSIRRGSVSASAIAQPIPITTQPAAAAEPHR
jgi:Tfp pilus assembly protein PilF